MKLHKRLWIAVISAGVVGLSAIAQAALTAPTDKHVSFVASGPAGMKIEGTTPDLDLAEQGDAIVITVPLTNLSTGIGLRDKHMKEKYLEVPKFPAATLSVARSALKIPAGGDKVETDVPSTVTLHGQTKPVTVHYDAKRDGASIVSHGTFRINMNDFGITVPVYLGVTVKPDVDVSASFRVAGS
ncbi:MAG: YceI family protein [Polyangiaceae bacterium]